MGMYSYITKQDLRVRKGCLHKLRQTIEKHRHGDGWRYYESVDICANGRVKLDDLNGCKIIGYWDRQFCRFLKDVGQYIRGVIALEYENDPYRRAAQPRRPHVNKLKRRSQGFIVTLW